MKLGILHTIQLFDLPQRSDLLFYKTIDCYFIFFSAKRAFDVYTVYLLKSFFLLNSIEAQVIKVSSFYYPNSATNGKQPCIQVWPLKASGEEYVPYRTKTIWLEIQIIRLGDPNSAIRYANYQYNFEILRVHVLMLNF